MDPKIEKERSKRKSFSVHWARFIKLYAKFKDEPVCFVEGEDIKYYGMRIENIIGTINFIESGGKNGVLKFREKLKQSEDFHELKSFFFIDRDFDALLNDIEIYETPCYSIENFYTSTYVLERILLSEFKLTRADEPFVNSMQLFQARQAEYHDASFLLNVFIACQREIENSDKELKIKLNIGDFKIGDFFELNLEKVSSKYTLEALYKYFPSAQTISDDLLTMKMKEFSQVSARERFRGKFEIEFFRWFLTAMIKVAKEGENVCFPEKVNIKLNLTKINILSDLSRFADNCSILEEYVKNRYNLITA